MERRGGSADYSALSISRVHVGATTDKSEVSQHHRVRVASYPMRLDDDDNGAQWQQSGLPSEEDVVARTLIAISYAPPPPPPVVPPPIPPKKRDNFVPPSTAHPVLSQSRRLVLRRSAAQEPRLFMADTRHDSLNHNESSRATGQESSRVMSQESSRIVSQDPNQDPRGVVNYPDSSRRTSPESNQTVNRVTCQQSNGTMNASRVMTSQYVVNRAAAASGEPLMSRAAAKVVRPLPAEVVESEEQQYGAYQLAQRDLYEYNMELKRGMCVCACL